MIDNFPLGLSHFWKTVFHEDNEVGMHEKKVNAISCSFSLGQDIEGYQPLWFEKRTDDSTGESTYVYRGGYWEAKDRQDWSQCPEIF